MEEYQDVKERLIENKSADPDGITEEILKRCEFDDIILEHANCVLNIRQKPTQVSTLHITTISIYHRQEKRKASVYLQLHQRS